jgi:hypothetical protein
MKESQQYVGLPEEEFLRRSVALVEQAEKDGVTLRILGSLAVYTHSLHVPACIEAFHALGRIREGAPLFTDLDLAGYAKQSRGISGLFERLRFKPDQIINGFFGDRRLVYYEPEGKFHVDIFLNQLEFSHTVDFGDRPGRGRLELDRPTIALADVVLEKLQIHEIARKDLVDLIILFLGHEVGPNGPPDRETIEMGYIAALLADDWGFWYESVQNLAKTRALLGSLTGPGHLTTDQAQRVEGRISRLEAVLQNAPKSKRWTRRARTGPAKPWYREVEEVVR